MPVLDGDVDGRLYERQKNITLECAKNAGFGDNIQVISEPKAAMIYILNSLRDSSGMLQNIDLQRGDEICVFDLGGGTLDVCFGRYKLENGIPDVDGVFSVGLYSDENGLQVSLCGDRLDMQMAIRLCEDLPDKDKLDDWEYDENNNFVPPLTVKSFGNAKWSTYVERHQAMKEELSWSWNNPDIAQVIYTQGRDVGLTKDVFKEVVCKDLSYAIRAMKDAMKANGMNELKYIFMVGGGSLIHVARTQLDDAFPACEVFNAYDILGAEKEAEFYSDENRMDLRTAAIYPVVRGAALAYMTKITHVFMYDVTIAPVGHEESEHYMLKFVEGECFCKREVGPIPRKIAFGEWLIFARHSVSDENKVIGSFSLKDITNDKPFSLTLIANVDVDRKLKIACSIPNDSIADIKEVVGLEVYV